VEDDDRIAHLLMIRAAVFYSEKLHLQFSSLFSCPCIFSGWGGKLKTLLNKAAVFKIEEINNIGFWLVA
jgi:hypothetical protein